MKIKTLALANPVKIFTLPKEATLRDLLKKWRYPKKHHAIFINRIKVHDFNTLLKDGDTIIAVGPMRAAAPPLQMKQFKKYLKNNNFKFQKYGKGDHEIWINLKGQKLSVNPNRRDKRYVDWASVRALKIFLNYSEREIINAVNRS